MTRITLTAADSHQFEAVTAGTPTDAKGGVVILQEIFGLNPHIRSLPARYAEAGYYAVAPALFDRAEANVSLDYNADGKTRGLALKAAVDAIVLEDVAAAITAAAAEGPVAIIGFCWGGSLAWRAATSRHDLAAAIAYYGGELPKLAAATAHCPVLAHFGEHDASIPMEGVAAFTDAQSDATPPVSIHTYDADHGFNCDARGQYNADAAAIAHDRTLAFLQKHMG